ncbi:MAG: DUF3322 domain-containing protein [Coriobacteriales bacterium]|jgi:hypothetical protein|nr:DUF3322 domain-containing protein [Coriobacteriales bacterium]
MTIAALMRGPDELRAWAQAKYRNSFRTWLGMADYGEACEFTLPLHPPAETAAGAAMDEVAQWIAQWRQVRWPSGCVADVEWKTVAWRALGTQRLPMRVRIKGASSIAALARTATSWEPLVTAANRLRRAWPQQNLDAVLPKLTADLETFDDDELSRLIDVVNWVVEHPASGMLPRQLPVPGVDSKWLERHRAVVEKLKAALTESSDLGLISPPARFGIRLLDERVSGVGDGDPRAFSAPILELARLVWQPAWVLIVENSQTLAALPSFPDMVAVFGQGKDAFVLANVPWIAEAPHLLYWGDLDTHGMHILGLVRKALPQTESILMDEDTLEHFASMTVTEPTPFTSFIGHLTEPELRVLARLRQTNTRLEQERIALPYAQKIITQLLQAP